MIISDIEKYMDDGRYTSEPPKGVKFNMPGYFKYLKEKHNGDSSKMTQEEIDMFVIKDEKKSVA